MGLRAQFLAMLQLLLGLSHVSMSELSKDDFFILVFPTGRTDHIPKRKKIEANESLLHFVHSKKILLYIQILWRLPRIYNKRQKLCGSKKDD